VWIQALPGIEWARSIGEVGRYIRQRFVSTPQTNRERDARVRSQPWLETQSWTKLSRRRKILTRLIRPVPRTDTLHVLRAAHLV
jgi:hypothetical protein